MPAQVNPIPFYDNCVKDSCACDRGGDCECFCTAVAAYAQACNEASVCVAWRTPEICRKLTLAIEKYTTGVKLFVVVIVVIANRWNQGHTEGNTTSD